jgi:hypothetical protein
MTTETTSSYHSTAPMSRSCGYGCASRKVDCVSSFDLTVRACMNARLLAATPRTHHTRGRSALHPAIAIASASALIAIAARLR